MLLLNFSHPITPAQVAQIEALTGATVSRTLTLTTQFDEQEPFLPQLQALVEQAALSPAEWQSEPMLVVPPSLNFICAALLAELHGRMGYFPPIVRTRAVAGALPRRYEIAEILDLQRIREDARRKR